MIYFAEYLEHVEGTAARYGRTPDTQWLATYTEFMKRPDNMYLAVKARWFGLPASALAI